MTVVTGQVPPHESSTEASAVALVHGDVPEQTRITGSPLHEPMVDVQPVLVLVVRLQPTVYERPGVHVNDRPGSQLQSRAAPEYVPPVQTRVRSEVLASGGVPASTIGAMQALAAESCEGHDG